jgi:hypothetical protein
VTALKHKYLNSYLTFYYEYSVSYKNGLVKKSKTKIHEENNTGSARKMK